MISRVPGYGHLWATRHYCCWMILTDYTLINLCGQLNNGLLLFFKVVRKTKTWLVVVEDKIGFLQIKPLAFHIYTFHVDDRSVIYTSLVWPCRTFKCTDPCSGCNLRVAGFSDDQWGSLGVASLHSARFACGCWWTCRYLHWFVSAVCYYLYLNKLALSYASCICFILDHAM